MYLTWEIFSCIITSCETFNFNLHSCSSLDVFAQPYETLGSTPSSGPCLPGSQRVAQGAQRTQRTRAEAAGTEEGARAKHSEADGGELGSEGLGDLQGTAHTSGLGPKGHFDPKSRFGCAS